MRKGTAHVRSKATHNDHPFGPRPGRPRRSRKRGLATQRERPSSPRTLGRRQAGRPIEGNTRGAETRGGGGGHRKRDGSPMMRSMHTCIHKGRDTQTRHSRQAPGRRGKTKVTLHIDTTRTFRHTGRDMHCSVQQHKLRRFTPRGGGTSMIRRKNHGGGKKGIKILRRAWSCCTHPPPTCQICTPSLVFLLTTVRGLREEWACYLSAWSRGPGPAVSGRYSTVGGGGFVRFLPMQFLMKEGFGTEDVQMDGGGGGKRWDAPAEGFCDWR